MLSNEEQSKEMQQIIAKCWADEGFKQKLLADPATTLRAEGVALPAGLAVVALEDTDRLFHLIIPARPSTLSDEDLDHVSGGRCGVDTRALKALEYYLKNRKK